MNLNLKKRLKLVIASATVALTTICMNLSTFAAGGPVVKKTDPSELNNKFEQIINTYALPFGGALTLGGVIAVAISIAINHNKPKERGEKLTGLIWLFGAISLLGLASIVAGVIFGATK